MMNHRGAEDTEKKKKVADASTSRGFACLSLFMLMVVIMACFCWGIPLFNLSIHYIQWRTQGIDEYDISFSHVGLWIPPPYLQYMKTDDGLINMTDMQPRSNQDVIKGLFSTAFNNSFIPFCSNHTEYNEKYGFPSKVGCYFIEGGWIEVTHFEPITHN